MKAVGSQGARHLADLSATPRRTDGSVEPAETEEAYDPIAEAAA